jgi:magnesium-protoporphyrin O-methyltransferase
VELLNERGLAGQTLLEVGGGIGAVQIELLRAGVSRAVSVEITGTYESSAAALLREAGVEDRVERRVLDITQAGSAVAAADIVVMNRVVCCYPRGAVLASAAAERAREVLVMTFPKRRRWTRVAVWLANLMLAAMRRQFHIFVHPPEQILRSAAEQGLRPVLNRPGIFWQLVALERS